MSAMLHIGQLYLQDLSMFIRERFSRPHIFAFVATLIIGGWGVVVAAPQPIIMDVGQGQGIESSTTVSGLLNKIRSGTSTNARADAAEEMAHWLRGENLLSVSEKDISDISELLFDKNDAVRFWAAVSIGHIGPRARFVASRVQKALTEVECVRVNGVSPSFSSAQGMRYALSQLGVTPIDRACK